MNVELAESDFGLLDHRSAVWPSLFLEWSRQHRLMNACLFAPFRGD
jgi:hypothetical protein